MSPARKRGSINLTALGSAAVVAVYAAGYLRTRPIAEKYERQDSERRPTPAATVAAPIDADRLMDTVRAETLRVAAPSPATAPKAALTPDKKQKAPPAAVTIDSVTAAKDSAPAPPALPVDSTPIPPQATATPPAPAAKDSVKVWKDGTYQGWGTSRHGDIQAAVEIQGGRIVKAYITQCLTRYSCSRIANIIPQVVERQSPEVDYVSGATQSTDAFYYAIVEALSKAK